LISSPRSSTTPTTSAAANTSGGLLIAEPPGAAAEVPGTHIGRLVDGRVGSVTVLDGTMVQ
jgi:hypothetical protein